MRESNGQPILCHSELLIYKINPSNPEPSPKPSPIFQRASFNKKNPPRNYNLNKSNKSQWKFMTNSLLVLSELGFSLVSLTQRTIPMRPLLTFRMKTAVLTFKWRNNFWFLCSMRVNKSMDVLQPRGKKGKLHENSDSVREKSTRFPVSLGKCFSFSCYGDELPYKIIRRFVIKAFLLSQFP